MPEVSLTKNQEFIEAYNSFSDAIYRHIYFRIFDKDRAKDLAQDTFTRTWDYLRKGRDVQNLKAFLYKVANNLIIDEYRKKKEVSLEVLQKYGFDVEGPDQNKIVQDVENSNVLRTIRALEPHHREIIVMRYINDLTIKEIAEIIGQSENVVSVRINRGVKELKKLLRV